MSRNPYDNLPWVVESHGPTGPGFYKTLAAFDNAEAAWGHFHSIPQTHGLSVRLRRRRPKNGLWVTVCKNTYATQ